MRMCYQRFQLFGTFCNQQHTAAALFGGISESLELTSQGRGALVCWFFQCLFSDSAFPGSVGVQNDNIDLRMFFNLTQALDYFRNEGSPLADKVLYAFENSCCVFLENALPTRRKPFIVIEGNHRQSRNVVGVRLARLVHGRYLVHPAHCLQEISGNLPKGTMFRRAFYVLSMYALAIEVKSHLSLGRSVVVNGYWWDMVTFAVVQAFPPEIMPDSRDQMFQFPKDLFQPDIVFFLNFPDNLFYRQVTTRNPRNCKPRVLKLYRQLRHQGHPVVIKDLTGVYGPITDYLYEIVLYNLSNHRDVWFDKMRVNFDYRGG